MKIPTLEEITEYVEEKQVISQTIGSMKNIRS